MAKVLILSQDHRLADHWKSGLVIEHEVFIEHDIEKAFEISQEMACSMGILHAEAVSADLANIARLNHNGLRSLIVGSDWDENKQINALVAGCYGYCEVDIAPDLLLKAVNGISKGEVWIPRHLIPKVIDLLVKSPSAPSKAEKIHGELKKNLSLLTHREVDVVEMLGEGLSNKAIASMLNISERTVKAHLTSIFQKLDVQDRLQLALFLKNIN